MTALAIGTANWGTSYGAPGLTAHVDRTAAAALAKAFVAGGHDLVDTAPAYGDAEAIVGEVFGGAARVVTKVGLIDGDVTAVVAHAVASVHRSLHLLRVDRLAGVLLHDPAAALAAPAVARSVLAALRAEGICDRVGVSVYSPDEALAAVDLLGADLLQVPCNVLDQRFAASCLAQLADTGTEVHVRSALLSGVLVGDPGVLAPGLAELREPLEQFHDLAKRLGVTPLRAAVDFVRQLEGVAAVVFGAFEPAQFREVVDAWEGPPLPVDTGSWRALAVDDERVDPRRWSR